MILEPCRRVWLKSERNYDGVRLEHFVGASNGLGPPATGAVGLTKFSGYNFDARYVLFAKDFERLPSLLFLTSRREPGMFSSSRR